MRQVIRILFPLESEKQRHYSLRMPVANFDLLTRDFLRNNSICQQFEKSFSHLDVKLSFNEYKLMEYYGKKLESWMNKHNHHHHHQPSLNTGLLWVWEGLEYCSHAPLKLRRRLCNLHTRLQVPILSSSPPKYVPLLGTTLQSGREGFGSCSHASSVWMGNLIRTVESLRWLCRPRHVFLHRAQQSSW